MKGFIAGQVVISFFLLQAITATAQKNSPAFYHLTIKNGLSCNRITDVIQDSRGFYWITTDDGLNRYNGSSCKIFRNVKNDSSSLSFNYTYGILEDDQGDIWVGTSMGVNRFIYKEDRFERFYLNHPTISFDRINMISGMVKDEKGNIWITSQGLWQYNIYSRKWKVFLNDPNESSTIPAGIVSHIQYDKKNNGFWMNVEGEHVFFDIQKTRFYHKKNNPSNKAIFKPGAGGGPFVLDSNNRIWCFNNKLQLYYYTIGDNNVTPVNYKTSKGFFNISVDPQNRIWLHYWFGGTIIFDPKTQEADSSFLAASHPQSALSNQANKLYIDKTGIYWIMSRKGISIYNPREQAVKYFLLPDKKTIDGDPNTIQCILEEDDTNCWIGTNTGLYKYDLSKNTYTYFENLPYSGAIIKCLYLQDKNRLWIGTPGNLCILDVAKKKIAKKFPFRIHTQFITADNKNNIWVGTWHNGLYHFSSKGELINYFSKGEKSSRTIRHNNLIGFKTDSARTHLWIGYNGGYGFCKLDYNENVFTHYKIQTSERYFNAINTINCFSEDSSKNLWIGANGGGLFYFNIKNNTFKNYTQSDGLKSNYVNAILPHESGHIWIATSNGLSVLNTGTDEIINTAIDIELGNNGFLPNGILRKNKKMLFFSGRKFIEVDPVQFQQNSYPSRILYSSFKIFDKEFQLEEDDNKLSKSLSYDQNFFSIEFSLFKPDPNSNSQYMYQLQGFDNEWINAGERRIANYTNVPPGNYFFHVKGTDAAGKNYFSKPIYISITPPLWKRWWFITAISVIVLFSLYFGYRYQIAQVKKVYSLRSKISQDLHDEVASTLSGIRLYSEMAKDQMEQDDQIKVHQSLEVISTNAAEMTQNMSDIVWTINPNNDSFSRLVQKLKGYATEITSAKGMQFHFDQESILPEEHLSMEQRRNLYLVCKESIHNAVKYSEANTVNMKVFCRDHHIHIHILDDGKGFDSIKMHEGNGLQNMRTRCHEINAGLVINSQKNQGTIIEVVCPFG